jgi:hypothetical protein
MQADQIGRRFGSADMRRKAKRQSGECATRPKCEHYLELDIRALRPRGYLDRRTDALVHIATRDDGSSAVVRIRVSDDHLRLTYGRAACAVEAQPINCLVRIENMSCRYGGTRQWFRCPRCDSRRAVLYGVADDGLFGCRGCMGLVYSSQDERRMSRLWRRQRELKSRLVDSWRRPKGMHWNTFAAICERLNATLKREDRLFCDGAPRVSHQCEQSQRTRSVDQSRMTAFGCSPLSKRRSVL